MVIIWGSSASNVIGYRLKDGVWPTVGTEIVSFSPRSGEPPTPPPQNKKGFLTVGKVATSPPSGDKINKYGAFPTHIHTFQWPRA